MNFQNKRFIFEVAKAEHGKELLEILEQNDFKGKISLIYTRRPDAYESLKKEGDEISIVVCKDLRDGKIIGFGACVVRKLYLNGKPERLGYLFGLRVRKECKGIYSLLSKGYEFLYSIYKDKGIPFFFTTILEENLYARKLLEKKRSYMPDYEPIGSYQVYTIKTKTRGVRSSHLKQAQRNDIPLLVEFLNSQGKNYQFFPVITEEDLIYEKFPGLSIEDFYILYNQKNDIQAAGAAWDQRRYKQYIVQGYRGILRFLYPLSSLFTILGYPCLSKPGNILKFFTLSFWAVKENNPDLFTCFISSISRHLNEYPFFLIGIHEKNHFQHVLQKTPHLIYKSQLYLVDWNKCGALTGKLENRAVPYLECGLL